MLGAGAGAGPAEIGDQVAFDELETEEGPAFNELEMKEGPATGEASTCGALSGRDSGAVVVNGKVT